MATLQQSKIKPCLWYDQQAEEAAHFYCSLFDDAAIISTSDMVVEFELCGIRFTGLNAGPRFKFSEAVSFMVLCDNQEEVDHFWNAFTSEGGEESMCGWCKDRFGLSWQVVPKRFIEMMETGTPEQAQRVMEVMMPMRKMVIELLEAAFTP